MSIIIHGGEMPKKEGYWIRVQPDGKILSRTGRVIEDAYAEQIPPHGRLIDADAIQQETDGKLAELQKVIDDASRWSEEIKDAVADKYTMLTAKEWIAWAPTIIEAEVEE